MLFLLVMFVRLMWWLIALEIWLCWALVALTVAAIASLTGHERVARQWVRSLNWRRALYPGHWRRGIYVRL